MSNARDSVPAPQVRNRDAVRTKEAILSVAVHEFAEHGLHGARVGRITKAANCNSRMIYHYFGGKEELYLAVLDRVYSEIRLRETQLQIGTGDPVEAARQLVAFTFDYFSENATFQRIIRNENLLNGEYIRQSRTIPDMSQPLVKSIDALITRGFETGAFVRKPDPVQFYVTIVALSAHHLNNAATLSAVVGTDLSEPSWKADRRQHAIDVLLGYLGITQI